MLAAGSGRPSAVPPVAVSVVIPTRNRLGLLQQSVASVTSQRGVPWELIVIDDASSDGTAVWLAEQDDGRVRPLRLPRPVDRSAARNRGLHAASGRYVLFLDDDDLLAPGALHALADGLDSHPSAVLAVGARAVFDESGQRRRTFHPRRIRICPLWPDVLAGWIILCGQVLARADVVRQAGGWNERLAVAEDQELWLRLATFGPSVLVPSPVLEHRSHGAPRVPATFVEVEDAVRKAYVDGLQGEARARGARLAATARAFRYAGEAFDHQEFRRAAREIARGLRTSPEVLRSPLMARPWVTSLAKGAALGVAGRRGGRAAHALTKRLRRALGSDPVMPRSVSNREDT